MTRDQYVGLAWLIVILLIVGLLSWNGCRSDNPSPDPATPAAEKMAEPSNTDLLEQIKELKKELASRGGAPKPVAEKPGGFTTGPTAVDAEKDYQRNRAKDARIAGERKLSAIEEAKEQKARAEDKVRRCKQEVDQAMAYIDNSNMLLEVSKRTPSRPSTESADAYNRRQLVAWTDTLRERKMALAEAQAKLAELRD